MSDGGVILGMPAAERAKAQLVDGAGTPVVRTTPIPEIPQEVARNAMMALQRLVPIARGAADLLAGERFTPRLSKKAKAQRQRRVQAVLDSALAVLGTDAEKRAGRLIVVWLPEDAEPEDQPLKFDGLG